jgi:hypothetical protein
MASAVSWHQPPPMMSSCCEEWLEIKTKKQITQLNLVNFQQCRARAMCDTFVCSTLLTILCNHCLLFLTHSFFSPPQHHRLCIPVWLLTTPPTMMGEVEVLQPQCKFFDGFLLFNYLFFTVETRPK